MNTPLFSIITITWNAESVITPTLDSVAMQHFKGYEYVVVDGASKDRTLPLIAERGALVTTLISEPDKGIYDAMNKGIAAAKGEYLIFLNAGDALYSPHTLEQIAGQIGEERPEVIYGETALVDHNRTFVGMRRLKTPERLDWRSFKRGMVVCHQAFIVKRTIAPRYDLTYRYSADFDWCIRCMQQSQRLHNTHLTLINYLNEGITTKHRKVSLKERYRIMCHYYGTVATALRHLYFAVRFGWARLSGGNP